jgi:hypothetical protein
VPGSCRTAALVVALALLPACTGEQGERLDDAAERACAELSPVVREIESGELTGPPLFRALQDVYNEARRSDTEGFADQVQDVYSAAIAENPDAVQERLTTLRGTCRLPA